MGGGGQPPIFRVGQDPCRALPLGTQLEGGGGAALPGQMFPTSGFFYKQLAGGGGGGAVLRTGELITTVTQSLFVQWGDGTLGTRSLGGGVGVVCVSPPGARAMLGSCLNMELAEEGRQCLGGGLFRGGSLFF